MSFVVNCQCGKQFKVADEQRGKKAKCPGCGTTLRLVPSEAAAPAPPPPDESDPFAGFDLEAAAAMEREAVVDENQGPRVAPTQPMAPAMPGGGRATPPALLAYATPAAGARTDLREIAFRQKALNYCILVYLVLIVARFVAPPEILIVVLALALVTIITGAVFVFMLAIALYGPVVGVILGLLTLIPCVNLIVLLVVSSKATNVLKQHGIQVGLLGAKSSQVPAPGQFRR